MRSPVLHWLSCSLLAITSTPDLGPLRLLETLGYLCNPGAQCRIRDKSLIQSDVFWSIYALCQKAQPKPNLYRRQWKIQMPLHKTADQKMLTSCFTFRPDMSYENDSQVHHNSGPWKNSGYKSYETKGSQVCLSQSTPRSLPSLYEKHKRHCMWSLH